jgi:S1-C subfamily serine protease
MLIIKRIPTTTVLAVLFPFIGFSLVHAEQSTSPNVPVSAPINSESAGKGGEVAIVSVFKIICRAENSAGTGFLHKSGNVITAAHVVKNCPEPEIMFRTGSIGTSRVVASDDDLDIAVIAPAFPIDASALTISSKADFKVGDQVSTWGFPGGYSGPSPMLSVGYLSGMQAVKIDKKIVTEWVINAAFNLGNSGGPLILIETGEVIGIVSSKITPISNDAVLAINALQNTKSGFTYTETLPDGTTKTIMEGQVVAMVLEELRKQVQLVIGNAVKLEDIRTFLVSQKIDP